MISQELFSNIFIDRDGKFLLYKRKYNFVFGERCMFLTAEPKEIKQGRLTDIYFVRTMQILKARKIDKWVRAEFIAKHFPED